MLLQVQGNRSLCASHLLLAARRSMGTVAASRRCGQVPGWHHCTGLPLSRAAHYRTGRIGRARRRSVTCQCIRHLCESCASSSGPACLTRCHGVQVSTGAQHRSAGSADAGLKSVKPPEAPTGALGAASQPAAGICQMQKLLLSGELGAWQVPGPTPRAPRLSKRRSPLPSAQDEHGSSGVATHAVGRPLLKASTVPWALRLRLAKPAHGGEVDTALQLANERRVGLDYR